VIQAASASLRRLPIVATQEFIQINSVETIHRSPGFQRVPAFTIVSDAAFLPGGSQKATDRSSAVLDTG